MIFDTHAHYDDEAFDDDREKLLERMQNRGVEYIVNVGASMSSCKSTIGLVRRFPYVYGALGVHPDEVSELTEEDYQWLKKSIYKPKIVAVGEIGLDYHWNDNKE
ncbi:MAG: TatD family hydrolase [Eubacterium ventriosum]